MSDKQALADIDNIQADTVLDATGLFCPEPVMMLHNKVRDVESGQIIEVIATDPSTTRDIPKFCLFLGHELMAKAESEERYLYYIRKK
ncbi:MAG: sulfurtransferase TusA [Pseudohongiellaceae bacterium]|nr:sulfurtransferase TusA [Pseudohongiellaceae bacterium]